MLDEGNVTASLKKTNTSKEPNGFLFFHPLSCLLRKAGLRTTKPPALHTVIRLGWEIQEPVTSEAEAVRVTVFRI